jgi:hypothetical protein
LGKHLFIYLKIIFPGAVIIIDQNGVGSTTLLLTGPTNPLMTPPVFFVRFPSYVSRYCLPVGRKQEVEEAEGGGRQLHVVLIHMPKQQQHYNIWQQYTGIFLLKGTEVYFDI